MKFYLILISIILTIHSYGQIDYINQDSLIINYRIKSIKTIIHWEDGSTEDGELWRFDSEGRLTFESILPDEDSIISETYYLYKNNLLTEIRHLGCWEYRTKKIDTEYVFLTYNKNSLLLREFAFNSNGQDTNYVTYEYDNSKQTKRTSTRKNSFRKSITTTKYQPNGTIILRTKSHFEWDTLEVYTEREYFDSSGFIRSITRSDYVDNCQQIRSIKTFVYSKSRQLERIIENSFYDFPWPMEFSFFERRFYYNNKGLLEKEERYSNGKYRNAELFEYEYYENPKTNGEKNNR